MHRFSCVQLMHQIDVLISEKQQELEDKVQALKTQLQCRERDLSALRVSLEQRDAEASLLSFELVINEIGGKNKNLLNFRWNA